jgi:hypothetical protein
MSTEIIARLAFDRHRILREYGEGVKDAAAVPAAVETMAKACAVRSPRGLDADVAAQATASKSLHAASPLKRSRNGYNEDAAIAIADAVDARRRSSRA